MYYIFKTIILLFPILRQIDILSVGSSGTYFALLSFVDNNFNIKYLK